MKPTGPGRCPKQGSLKLSGIWQKDTLGEK
jgi:hypothetical protein